MKPPDETCGRTGCFATSHWYPVLLLYPKGAPDWPEPIKSIVGLPHCQHHADTAKLTDFLTDESWARITAAIEAAGYAEPDRDTIQLDFLPWNHPDVLALKNARRSDA